MRREDTYLRKILAKGTFDKGLFPKIYKDFLKLHKKIKNLILKKWLKTLIYLIKEDI